MIDPTLILAAVASQGRGGETIERKLGRVSSHATASCGYIVDISIFTSSQNYKLHVGFAAPFLKSRGFIWLGVTGLLARAAHNTP